MKPPVFIKLMMRTLAVAELGASLLKVIRPTRWPAGAGLDLRLGRLPMQLLLLTVADPGPNGAQLRAMLDLARAAALGRGAAPHDADDVAQVTTLKLYLKWSTPTVQRAFQSGSPYWDNYVAKAARYTYLDLVRSTSRRQQREQKADEAPGTGAATSLLAATESHAEEHLAEFLLADAISRLPNRVRRVAELAFIHDRSISQIAAELELSAGRTRWLRRRAEHMVADQLRQRGD